MTILQIIEQLGLNGLQDRECHVRGTSCAVTGDGLYEGLDWACEVLKRR